ncbi:hypothetical protein LVJ94_45490 [Pendulispora rubella]|uniref:Lipoprotein n=1 Tax=Pendulispora rubella TaxID=2741070 RepID=A0ABZ2KZN8_9BACT
MKKDSAALFGLFLSVVTACGGSSANRGVGSAAVNLAKFDETVFTIDPEAAPSGAPRDRGAVEIPFDRTSASDALVAACETVRNCYNGFPVAVVVTTTFEQDGHALVAHVDQPLSVVGTLIASCIEDRFRNVHVHQFSGDPVTASQKCRVGRDVNWECSYDDCATVPSSQFPELFPPR